MDDIGGRTAKGGEPERAKVAGDLGQPGGEREPLEGRPGRTCALGETKRGRQGSQGGGISSQKESKAERGREARGRGGEGRGGEVRCRSSALGRDGRRSSRGAGS